MDILNELDKLAKELPAPGIKKPPTVIVSLDAWEEFTEDYKTRTGVFVHPNATTLEYNGFTVVRSARVDFEMP